MADSTISNLTKLGTTPAVNDVFVIADITASASKGVIYTNTGIPANTVHRASDGKNHADVVLNNTHRASDGKNHADVVLNNTHRASNGINHANVVLNDTHRGSNGTNHANVVLNDTHRGSDGKNHADVVTNTTNIGTNTTNIGTNITGVSTNLSSINALKQHTLSLPVINGGGFAITTGEKKMMYRVPFNCTITGAGFLADQSTTTTIDIWKDTYANYPPTNADSITGAAPLSSTATDKDIDTTLTGWTTALSEGDILFVNIDANDNAQIIGIFLEVTRT